MNYYNEIKNKLIDNEIYEKVSPLGTQLSWSHCRALLTIKDYNEINYYINISIKQNLSKRELECKIKSKEYER